jgi:hypothetical protein
MRQIVLILLSLAALPGCCVLEMHSPISPLGFVKASRPSTTTPVSDKVIRPSIADNSSAPAAKLAD